MNCPNCGAVLTSGDRFCQSCGSAAPIGRSCSVCGARVSPTAAFCAGCGSPVAKDKPKLHYRGVFVRFLAAIVDSIVYFAAAWVLAGSASLGTTSAEGFDLNGTPTMLLSLASLGYYVVFEGLFGGTIGKLILGLRVVNRKGRAPGIGAALVRNLLRIVDFLPLFYVVGVIAVLASEKKQRVGDRVAGTYVISR